MTADDPADAPGLRVAIHQPHYLPWLRYFEKAASSGLFIVLDDVAYEKNGFQNRNKVKTPTGWQYLTVPVRAQLGQAIGEVEVASAEWARTHVRALEMHYAHAAYRDCFLSGLKDIYSRPWRRLAELNAALFAFLLEALGIRTPVVASSTLSVPGVGTERLVNLCREVGATSYYSGEYAGRTYLDAQAFGSAGISLEYQRWECPVYAQQYRKAGFVPDLSIVDLLMNEGPRSLDILRSGADVRSAGAT